MGSMWDDVLDNAMGLALPGPAVLSATMRSPLPPRSPATPAPRQEPTDNAGRTVGTAGATLVQSATAAGATPAKIPRADAAERVSFWAAIRAKVPEAMVGEDAGIFAWKNEKMGELGERVWLTFYMGRTIEWYV